MGYSQIVMWVIALAAFCVSGEVQAVKVTYTGTGTITSDTSGIPLSATDLGFADGTNLQGQTVSFSIMFDDGAFDADSEPGDTEVGSYAYNGASTYTYQVTGGSLVSKALDEIGIGDGIVDAWGAQSTVGGMTAGVLSLRALSTLFDDDSLRTVVDPADFTLGPSFNNFNIFYVSGEQALATIGSDIDEVGVTVEMGDGDGEPGDGDGTVVPTPAAAGAGLVLLGGLLTRRERRRAA